MSQCRVKGGADGRSIGEVRIEDALLYIADTVNLRRAPVTLPRTECKGQ